MNFLGASCIGIEALKKTKIGTPGSPVAGSSYRISFFLGLFMYVFERQSHRVEEEETQ